MLNSLVHSLAHIFTDFGDDAVTGALALAIIGYLFLSRQRKAALMFASAFVATVGILAAVKMALYSRCNPVTVFYGLRSPSGHGGLSIVVYGLFAALVSTSLSGWRRVLPFMLAVPLVLAVSLSRVLLRAHTAGDVIVGAAVGLVICASSWMLWMRGETVHIDWRKLSLVALTVLALMYGMHFSAEDMLKTIAQYFRMKVPC